jgi:SpoIID/LytB domain protein
VFGPSGRRVFGPTRAGAGVLVRYQTGASRPALLTLPQTGRLLRWGHLEVQLVRRGGTPLHRAVAVIPFNRYLRGLAEMPGSFAMETLKAQAIAARSYALATLLARGQHWGAGRWDGCNCAVYADVRDQHYAGYAKEVGHWGARWVAAVGRTGSLVVRYHGRVVQAFYSSSSGGHTASNRVWGSTPLPWLPSRPDPDDQAAGRNPNHHWTVHLTAATVSTRLRSLGVGRVTGLRVSSRIAGSGGRVGTVRVAGTRRTVSVSGARIRGLLGFKSTKFSIRSS